MDRRSSDAEGDINYCEDLIEDIVKLVKFLHTKSKKVWVNAQKCKLLGLRASGVVTELDRVNARSKPVGKMFLLLNTLQCMRKVLLTFGSETDLVDLLIYGTGFSHFVEVCRRLNRALVDLDDKLTGQANLIDQLMEAQAEENRTAEEADVTDMVSHLLHASKEDSPVGRRLKGVLAALVVAYGADGDDRSEDDKHRDIIEKVVRKQPLQTDDHPRLPLHHVNFEEIIFSMKTANTSKLVDLEPGMFGDVFMGKYRGKNVAVKGIASDCLGTIEYSELLGESGKAFAMCHDNLVQSCGVCALREIHKKHADPVIRPGKLGRALSKTSLVGSADKSDVGSKQERARRLVSGSPTVEAMDDHASSSSSENLHWEQCGFIVTEFYENQSLNHLIHSVRRKLVFPTVHRVAKEVAFALQYLHTSAPPILSGAIKSSNILLDGEGHAKMADFGMHLLKTACGRTDDDVNGLRWMAPELVLSGSNNAMPTFASDVYAFGLLCWEMVSGRQPWPDALSEEDLREGMRDGLWERRWPVGTPEPFVTLAEACLNDEAPERPTLEQILEQLCLLESYGRVDGLTKTSSTAQFERVASSTTSIHPNDMLLRSIGQLGKLKPEDFLLTETREHFRSLLETLQDNMNLQSVGALPVQHPLLKGMRMLSNLIADETKIDSTYMPFSVLPDLAIELVKYLEPQMTVFDSLLPVLSLLGLLSRIEENHEAISNSVTISLALEALTRYAKDKKAGGMACLLLSNVCATREKRMLVTEGTGLKLVCTALEAGLDSAETCARACAAMQVVAVDAEAAVKLCDLPAVALIAQVLTNHADNYITVRAALGALWRLCAHPPNAARACELAVMQSVRKALQSHRDDPEVAMNAAGSLMAVIVALGQSQREALVDAGAINLAMKALHVHSGRRDVAEALLGALDQLYLSGDTPEDLDPGMVRLILHGLKRNRTFEIAAARGCNLLATVCENEHNAGLAVERDGIRLVLAILKLHSAVCSAAVPVLKAVLHLAVRAEDRDSISTLGGITSILRALEANIQDAAVCDIALACLLKLADGSEALAKKQLEKGVAQLVVSTLRRHEADVVVVSQCCKLLLTLTTDLPLGQEKILAQEVVALLIAAYTNHHDKELVRSLPLDILVNLGVDGTTLQTIAVQGGCEGFIRILRDFDETTKYVRLGCHALVVLSADPQNSDYLVEHGTVKLIIKVMASHLADLGIIQNGIGVLLNVASIKNNQVPMAEDGVFNAIEIVLRRHGDVATFVEVAFQAMHNLLVDKNNKLVIAKNQPMIDVLVSTTLRHLNSVAVTEKGSLLFLSLCEDEVARGELPALKVVPALRKIFNAYRGKHKEIEQYSGSALASLDDRSCTVM